MSDLEHSDTDTGDDPTQLAGARNLFSISELYHENSRITPSNSRIVQSESALRAAPNGFKRYRYAPHIELPSVDRNEDQFSVFSAIVMRRSRREYSAKPLELKTLSELAFYTCGMVNTEAGVRRCFPSAGGLYPLELYVVSTNVDGLPRGIYHYNPRAHAFAQVKQGDSRSQLQRMTFVGDTVQAAGAVFVFTAMFGRSKIKYGERAYRFALLEAGHAMQNACLAATVMGLGVCPIGGFVDDQMNDLLNVDGVEEAALYAAMIGVV